MATSATSTATPSPQLPAPGLPQQPVFWSSVIAVASVKFLLHLYASQFYGYLGDELYFLAAAKRLAWGYVDIAPGAALYAWFDRRLLGESLPAIRFIATLAGAIKVLFTGMIAARLGGGRVSQFLASLTVLVTPIFLVMDSLLGMNAVEPLFWMEGAYLLILLVQTGNQKLWLWFGVICGLGLQNKHSMIFFAFAVLTAVLLTPLRNALGRKEIWAGAALAFVIFLPNLIWQYRNGFPTLELLRNVNQSRQLLLPSTFLVEQIAITFPPLWLLGLAWLFWQRDGRRYRVLACVYGVLLILFILFKAKNYYLVPIYPPLIAAGAVASERWLRRPAVLLPVTALGLILGVVATFTNLPLLTPEHYNSMVSKMGALSSWRKESRDWGRQLALPGHWADQFGWEGMTAEVARAYRDLPPEERSHATIFASNYREAAALEFFGPKYGLPQPISRQQNYFLWGPRDYSGKVALVIGFPRSELEEYYGSVTVAGRFFHRFALPEENREFFICRDLKLPVLVFWQRVKLYQ